FVEISDTGIGILPDALSRIFKPFEQGGPDLVQRFGGLGLGLAISKATVEAHHGCLTAKSKGLDKGATFILELATIS
ncbi:MAG TPA: ATP-binding protein, partial [Terrimicrobiaceae bacterium]